MKKLALLGALALSVFSLVSQADEKPLHREGYRGGTWVLLDYGCIAVHVFSPEARAFYNLERLWQDGRPVDLTAILETGEWQMSRKILTNRKNVLNYR